MDSEIHNCQNCKKDFTIEPDDFGFYEKIKVPPPTLCSDCRSQRRMAWRNDYCFYNRQCDLCGTNIISIYSKDKKRIIYCPKCWWSDSWNTKDYSQNIDFSKSFFEQFLLLLKETPALAILNDNNIASINCLYTNYFAQGKDCYFVINSWKVENCMYSSFCVDAKDTVDSSILLENCRSIYSSIFVDNSYNCKYTYRCSGIFDSIFCFDCRGCNNCLMCYGLRNKSYCFKNKQYTKEEYQKILDSYELDSFSGYLKAKKEFDDFIMKFPRRYASLQNCIDCTGEYLMQSKNTKDSFIAIRSENSRFFQRGDTIKESYDCLSGGEHELAYESNNADNSRLVAFTNYCHKCTDTFYSDSCQSCENIFGCVGLKKASYCILNKQYSKEEYFILRDKIIEHMKKGKEWGEFLPINLSVFGYNETIAQDEYPLTKTKVVEFGYKWQDEIQFTKGLETITQIPDKIGDVPDQIINEIFKCVSCQRNYKITDQELKLYRKGKIPIPRECFFCRFNELQKRQGPMKIWHRQCMCDKQKHFHGKEKCEVEFETSYAPERPEIIYCEKCYQQEVY